MEVYYNANPEFIGFPGNNPPFGINPPQFPIGPANGYFNNGPPQFQIGPANGYFNNGFGGGPVPHLNAPFQPAAQHPKVCAVQPALQNQPREPNKLETASHCIQCLTAFFRCMTCFFFSMSEFQQDQDFQQF